MRWMRSLMTWGKVPRDCTFASRFDCPAPLAAARDLTGLRLFRQGRCSLPKKLRFYKHLLTQLDLLDTTGKSKVRTRVILDSESGQRLDNFLIRELKGVPKSRIYRIIRDGQVRINGGRSRAAARLGTGDRVRIPPLRLADLDRAFGKPGAFAPGFAEISPALGRSLERAPRLADDHIGHHATVIAGHLQADGFRAGLRRVLKFEVGEQFRGRRLGCQIGQFRHPDGQRIHLLGLHRVHIPFGDAPFGAPGIRRILVRAREGQNAAVLAFDADRLQIVEIVDQSRDDRVAQIGVDRIAGPDHDGNGRRRDDGGCDNQQDQEIPGAHLAILTSVIRPPAGRARG